MRIRDSHFYCNADKEAGCHWAGKGLGRRFGGMLSQDIRGEHFRDGEMFCFCAFCASGKAFYIDKNEAEAPGK